MAQARPTRRFSSLTFMAAVFIGFTALTVIFVMDNVSAQTALGAVAYHSPSAIITSIDAGVIYVAESTSNSVAVLNPKDGNVK